MLEDIIKELFSGFPGSKNLSQRRSLTSFGFARQWLLGFKLCALSLVICVLLTVTPLTRIPDPVINLQLVPESFLAKASSWLPLTLGPANQLSTAYIEFFLLIFLAFVCYALGAVCIGYQAEKTNQKKIRRVIWLSTVLAGTIYAVTPAMLSHDILVYASYSRVLGAYHANPYFVPISAFPHDPFTALNYWAGAVSAYGPVWTLVCGLFGWLLSPNLTTYTVVFRLFALAIQLLNTWLVGRILQIMGRSPRIVTLGMLLYAWNPLLLLESSLGGHNDGLMITFVLSGILLATSAEVRGQILHARGYLPAVIALTLAVLVKFTALPILALYLLFPAYKWLRSTVESPLKLRQALRNWRPALLALLCSCLVSLLIALVFYGPFWLGHSVKEIVASFKDPPSAQFSENSFMRSVIDWLMHHSTQRKNPLLQCLSNRHFWDHLNLAAIIICLLLGAIFLWFRLTIRTLVVSALATMCVILLITPWFYSWYITWILGLAVVCLPVHRSRVETALLALTCTFSFTALLTYLFDAGLFGPHFYLISLFTTIPPACTFLFALVLWQPVSNRISGDTIQ